MMSTSSAPIKFPDRASWRQWLVENHRQRTEVWLVIGKKGRETGCILLEEAVLEALCFGWIDSQLRARDEATYELRFSPRRANSVWSIRNIRKVEKLIDEGLMTEAGLERIRRAKDSGQWDAAYRRELVDLIPADLERALRKRSGCLDAYRKLPPSRKQQVIHWLETAKQAETRGRRIQAIVDELAD